MLRVKCFSSPRSWPGCPVAGSSRREIPAFQDPEGTANYQTAEPPPCSGAKLPHSVNGQSAFLGEPGKDKVGAMVKCPRWWDIPGGHPGFSLLIKYTGEQPHKLWVVGWFRSWAFSVHCLHHLASIHPRDLPQKLLLEKSPAQVISCNGHVSTNSSSARLGRHCPENLPRLGSSPLSFLPGTFSVPSACHSSSLCSP